jgi:hypothetical protein
VNAEESKPVVRRRKMVIQRKVLACFLVSLSLSVLQGFSATNDDFLPEFAIQANASQYVVGTPILLKSTLHNAGPREYKVVGEPHLAGGGMCIDVSQRGSPFKIFGSPWLGPNPTGGNPQDAASPMYRFMGRIPTNGEQCLVHMIQTKELQPGPLRLRVNLRTRTKGVLTNLTAEVEVSLLEPKQDDKTTVLDAATKNLVNKEVERLHNFCGQYRARQLLSDVLLQELISSTETNIDVEYALYAVVVQGAAHEATQEDRTKAKDAAKAFLQKFPRSWVVAHTYAALARIYKEEGRDEERLQAIQQGLSVPESRPLFQSLRLIPTTEGKGDKSK